MGKLLDILKDSIRGFNEDENNSNEQSQVEQVESSSEESTEETATSEQSESTELKIITDEPRSVDSTLSKVSDQYGISISSPELPEETPMEPLKVVEQKKLEKLDGIANLLKAYADKHSLNADQINTSIESGRESLIDKLSETDDLRDELRKSKSKIDSANATISKLTTPSTQVTNNDQDKDVDNVDSFIDKEEKVQEVEDKKTEEKDNTSNSFFGSLLSGIGAVIMGPTALTSGLLFGAGTGLVSAIGNMVTSGPIKNALSKNSLTAKVDELGSSIDGLSEAANKLAEARAAMAAATANEYNSSGNVDFASAGGGKMPIPPGFYSDKVLYNFISTAEGNVGLRWYSNKASKTVCNKCGIGGWDFPGGVHSPSIGKAIGVTPQDMDGIGINWKGYGRRALEGEIKEGATWGQSTQPLPPDHPYWKKLIPYYRDAMIWAWNQPKIQAVKDPAERLARMHSVNWWGYRNMRLFGGGSGFPHRLQAAKKATASMNGFGGPSEADEEEVKEESQSAVNELYNELVESNQDSIETPTISSGSHTESNSSNTTSTTNETSNSSFYDKFINGSSSTTETVTNPEDAKIDVSDQTNYSEVRITPESVENEQFNKTSIEHEDSDEIINESELNSTKEDVTVNQVISQTIASTNIDESQTTINYNIYK